MRKILVAALLFNSIAYAKDDSFELSVDRYYSPYTGGNLMITGLRAYQAVDDIFLSGSGGDTSNAMSFARSGKMIFEFVLSNYAMIAQHEYFGHGYRAREFDQTNIRYRVRPFSGYTSMAASSYNPLHVNAKAALAASGMEATSILAKQLNKNWITSDAIDRREAILYLVNSFDETRYVFKTNKYNTNNSNDVVSYISMVNAWQGPRTLTAGNLKMKTAWNLLDPMIYYSAYSIFRYLWLGEAYVNFETLKMGDAKFMPTTRTWLAPWGPELQLQNHFYTSTNKYLGVHLRGGRTGVKKSYGVDINVDPIATYDRFYLSNSFSVWFQPHLLISPVASTNVNKYGFAEFFALNVKVNPSVVAQAEIGYKTSGYLPGTPLRRGPLYRVALRFNLDIVAI